MFWGKYVEWGNGSSCLYIYYTLIPWWWCSLRSIGIVLWWTPYWHVVLPRAQARQGYVSPQILNLTFGDSGAECLMECEGIFLCVQFLLIAGFFHILWLQSATQHKKIIICFNYNKLKIKTTQITIVLEAEKVNISLCTIFKEGLHLLHEINKLFINWIFFCNENNSSRVE